MGNCCRDGRCFYWPSIKGGTRREGLEAFFCINGAYIAIREKTAPVPNTPDDEQELKEAIAHYADGLEVDGHLQAYRATMQSFEEDIAGARYYLLQLDTKAWTISITGYRGRELIVAEGAYVMAEKEATNKPERDTVLVSVGSLAELKRGYPNYFADTHVFLGTLKDAIS